MQTLPPRSTLTSYSDMTYQPGIKDFYVRKRSHFPFDAYVAPEKYKSNMYVDSMAAIKDVNYVPFPQNAFPMNAVDSRTLLRPSNDAYEIEKRANLNPGTYDVDALYGQDVNIFEEFKPFRDTLIDDSARSVPLTEFMNDNYSILTSTKNQSYDLRGEVAVQPLRGMSCTPWLNGTIANAGLPGNYASYRRVGTDRVPSNCQMAPRYYGFQSN